jgi:Protein of unknown function (DUF2892)
MFYRKNLGSTERWLRFAAGGVLTGCGLALFGASALGLALAGSGAIAGLTGVVGFCPACAMVGRGLPAAPGGGHNGQR